MELSTFSENIITETFERSGDAVVLKINIDAIVPEYHEALNDRLQPTIDRLTKVMADHRALTVEIDGMIKEQDKKGKKKAKNADINKLADRAAALRKEVDELNREVYAERLTCPVKLPDGSYTCLLKGWDMTDNGVQIDASKENLLRLPPKAVTALHDFVVSKLETVKKKVDEVEEEISESTPNGSRGLRAVGQTG